MAIEPAGLQVPLFVGLSVLWALTLGLGVAFLLFGWPYTKRLFAGFPRLAPLAHVSVAWLLANWWFHDILHVVLGVENLWYLLGIEYGFHVTLMIAGGVLAWSFYKAAGAAGRPVSTVSEPSEAAPITD